MTRNDFLRGLQQYFSENHPHLLEETKLTKELIETMADYAVLRVNEAKGNGILLINPEK